MFCFHNQQGFADNKCFRGKKEISKSITQEHHITIYKWINSFLVCWLKSRIGPSGIHQFLWIKRLQIVFCWISAIILHLFESSAIWLQIRHWSTLSQLCYDCITLNSWANATIVHIKGTVCLHLQIFNGYSYICTSFTFMYLWRHYGVSASDAVC